MKFTVAVGSLFVSMASMAIAENVVTLGDADFDAHVAENKYVLAEFFAPWCGHCKTLAPEFEKAATHFVDVEVEGGLSLAAIDATEAKDLASKFDVSGFPTLKWFVDGTPSEYGGGRTSPEIISWVTKKTGPATTDIADEAALNKFKESSDVTVFGYFADEDSAKAFKDAASSYDDASFGLSTTVSAGLDANSVVVYRNFEGEDKEVKCEDVSTKDAIVKCVSGNVLPLIVPFSQETAPKIFGGAIKQHVLVFHDSANADHDVAGKTVETAKAKKGEYLFVSVDKSDDRILEFFGITAEDLPTARIVEMEAEGMKKYAIEGEFTSDSLTAFVEKHTAGELAQELKSEDDIPDEEQPKDEGVWVLVGHNHDRIAQDKTKNVLVEYYAPWCGHCKKIAPEYVKLAAHYKDDDKVTIAKMDSTANEVASVQVSGFPTLKFYPAGTDEVLDFDGGREEEGMKTYIEANRK